MDTPFYPFPFRLEPLSLNSLACYVYAEMPPEKALDAKEWAGPGERPRIHDRGFDRIRKSVFKLAGRRHPHHVGEIYDLIIKIISDPARHRDSDFRPESYRCQASWDDWGRGYAAPPRKPSGESQTQTEGARQGQLIIAQMATRTEAIAALKEVAGQGEAPHLRGDDHDEPSHFARFVGIYQELEKIVKRRQWSPVRAVPCNPTTFPEEYRGRGHDPNYVAGFEGVGGAVQSAGPHALDLPHP